MSDSTNSVTYLASQINKLNKDVYEVLILMQLYRGQTGLQIIRQYHSQGKQCICNMLHTVIMIIVLVLHQNIFGLDVHAQEYIYILLVLMYEMSKCAGKHLPEGLVLKIFTDICLAVSRLHHRTKPIIHRDLKVIVKHCGTKNAVTHCTYLYKPYEWFPFPTTDRKCITRLLW